MAPPDAPAAPGRADGGAAVAVALTDGRQHLAMLEQRSPWRVLFPRPERGDLDLAVLANTGGGICGGDRAGLTIRAGAGTRLVVTTQAAEKLYCSTGPDARIDTSLAVEADAWLEWVPQETILFDRSRLARRIEIDLAETGRLLAAEMVIYGRAAHGEAWRQGLFSDRWRVRRGGRLAWADSLWLADDVAEVLASPAGFGGARATATVLAVGPGAEALQAGLRDHFAAGSVRASATLLNGVLIGRLIGPDPQSLRTELARHLGWLRTTWAGLPDRVPRLWQI
ncbi:MAG: urease accessory protein UreD [Rhodospirillaceae bacterium]|nr:urease accessory protein UreD [Rhodospirillaceae bacterium]